jgi:hypothetical protein
MRGEELPAVVPLFLCGGAYCAAYEIDKQPFRAVIDTGSPFMLVDGTCGRFESSLWGCYRGEGREAGLSDTDVRQNPQLSALPTASERPACVAGDLRWPGRRRRVATGRRAIAPPGSLLLRACCG